MAGIDRGAGGGFLGTVSRRGDALRAADVEALKDGIRRGRIAVVPPLELTDRGPAGTVLSLKETPGPFAARTGSGGIPAMTGPDGSGVYTMGSGTVTVYSAIAPPALAPTTLTLTVYNMAAGASGAVAGNALIQCKYLDGTPVVDWEACP